MVEENVDTKMVVIGELTFDEQDTLNKVIYHGLGFGLDKSGVQSHSLPDTADHENKIVIKEEVVIEASPIDYGK